MKRKRRESTGNLIGKMEEIEIRENRTAVWRKKRGLRGVGWFG